MRLSFALLLLLTFPVDATTADATWRAALAQAQEEKKPVVIFFRPTDCERCDKFEQASIPHPTIQRRLPNFVFASLPVEEGEAAKQWALTDPGVAFFDRSGALRARWIYVPDTTNFGVILDSVAVVAPQFERAVQRIENGAPHDAELDVAIGLARLGRTADARAALARAREHGSPDTQQGAMVLGAVLDASEDDTARALQELRQVVAAPLTPKLAADAWMAIGAIHRKLDETDEAIHAYSSAEELFDETSPDAKAAQQAIASLRAKMPRASIRILPLGRQLVTGRQTVRTQVSSAAVARVAFSLDGREVGRVDRPPFSTSIDFGAVPERRSIRVAAFDRKGQQIGSDERVVNEGGETFWLRLTSPREGPASGRTRVTMNARTPAARRIRRLVVSWNDADRAMLTQPPWEAVVDIPGEQVGVLRALAELDDGRTSEDAILLNAGGAAGRSDVQLVELPVTVMSRTGATPTLTPETIRVREGSLIRRVESVATAAETPLTVGLLIDVSSSMQKTLPDVQEAAIRFLETTLGERDRAFLVTFDTRARLLQAATSDLAVLRRQIMRIRPNGYTALHDAMVLGLLQFEGIKGRRAMIVFSDGIDLTSRYKAGDVAELARRVSVPIHVIASTPGVPAALGAPVSTVTGALDPNLARLARSTAGTAHALQSLTELPAVYASIEAALRAQVLAFIRIDPATRENEWRNVQVQVDGAELEVYAPEGYYAAW